ncbi:ATP-grasp fold amidoligase family protein [Croceicoccus hydrothermalis]|uniref:ATP-grasp fold amidoligase family protein n=1 Tax=Croceicoccus hydrothermalis TaxID=2867964 RepID=UPI001EFA7AD6|nr:ATP-grasp fold amidoligase family protein [Croceicoccus hydrothermalis]
MDANPADVNVTPAFGARLRIALCYAARMGRSCAVDNPRRFTEFVQRRKLYDRDPAMPRLLDKLYAKRLVAGRLGSEWVAPLAWEGTALPARPPVSGRAMLKSRHGCNQYRALYPSMPQGRWDGTRRDAHRWLRSRYGAWLDEWGYRDVPRGLMIEGWLGDGETLPVDYKIYVFGGAATHVQVHTGRGGWRHRWHLHDRDWKRVDGGEPLLRPRSLDAMIEAAETLSGAMPFVRVDFYELHGCPVFGEFCFYPGSGLDRFHDDATDLALGELWALALSTKNPVAPIRDPNAHSISELSSG